MDSRTKAAQKQKEELDWTLDGKRLIDDGVFWFRGDSGSDGSDSDSDGTAQGVCSECPGVLAITRGAVAGVARQDRLPGCLATLTAHPVGSESSMSGHLRGPPTPVEFERWGRPNAAIADKVKQVPRKGTYIRYILVSMYCAGR